MLFGFDIVTARASLTYCLVHRNDVLHSQVPVEAHATVCKHVHVGRCVFSARQHLEVMSVCVHVNCVVGIVVDSSQCGCVSEAGRA